MTARRLGYPTRWSSPPSRASTSWTRDTRTEHDLLGEAEIPVTAYWGIHTMRAVANFPITGIPVGHFPDFVRALVMVKQAAARANKRLGHLAPAKADAIETACARIATTSGFP